MDIPCRCPPAWGMSTLPRPSHWAHWLATGLGSGLSPWMPGTVGTLTVIPLYLLLQPHWLLYTMMLVAMIAVGPWLCTRTALDFGGIYTINGFGRAKLESDHQAIVWDEWVGLLVTLWLVPYNPLHLLLGFLIFRFYDMVKPWPISWVDRHVHGGFGAMLDDILAGVAAAVTLQLGLHYWS